MYMKATLRADSAALLSIVQILSITLLPHHRTGAGPCGKAEARESVRTYVRDVTQ